MLKFVNLDNKDRTGTTLSLLLDCNMSWNSHRTNNKYFRNNFCRKTKSEEDHLKKPIAFWPTTIVGYSFFLILKYVVMTRFIDENDTYHLCIFSSKQVEIAVKLVSAFHLKISSRNFDDYIVKRKKSYIHFIFWLYSMWSKGANKSFFTVVFFFSLISVAKTFGINDILTWTNLGQISCSTDSNSCWSNLVKMTHYCDISSSESEQMLFHWS